MKDGFVLKHVVHIPVARMQRKHVLGAPHRQRQRYDAQAWMIS